MVDIYAGPPWQARQARFGPCLDFGFQYALIRNNQSKNFGVEYWTLPGSNLLWRLCDNTRIAMLGLFYVIYVLVLASFLAFVCLYFDLSF